MLKDSPLSLPSLVIFFPSWKPRRFKNTKGNLFKNHPITEGDREKGKKERVMRGEEEKEEEGEKEAGSRRGIRRRERKEKTD